MSPSCLTTLFSASVRTKRVSNAIDLRCVATSAIAMILAVTLQQETTAARVLTQQSYTCTTTNLVEFDSEMRKVPGAQATFQIPEQRQSCWFFNFKIQVTDTYRHSDQYYEVPANYTGTAVMSNDQDCNPNNSLKVFDSMDPSPLRLFKNKAYSNPPWNTSAALSGAICVDDFNCPEQQDPLTCLLQPCPVLCDTCAASDWALINSTFSMIIIFDHTCCDATNCTTVGSTFISNVQPSVSSTSSTPTATVAASPAPQKSPSPQISPALEASPEVSPHTTPSSPDIVIKPSPSPVISPNVQNQTGNRTTPTAASSTGSSSSTPMVAGVAAGGTAVVIIAAVAAFCILRHRRHSKRQDQGHLPGFIAGNKDQDASKASPMIVSAPSSSEVNIAMGIPAATETLSSSGGSGTISRSNPPSQQQQQQQQPSSGAASDAWPRNGSGSQSPETGVSAACVAVAMGADAQGNKQYASFVSGNSGANSIAHGGQQQQQQQVDVLEAHSSEVMHNTASSLHDKTERMLDSLRLEWSDIALGREIGRGGFGRVMLGTWQGIRVAIKQLNIDRTMSPKVLGSLRQEALIMSELRHPNIARVFGLIDDAPNYALVMQYYKKGTVSHLMQCDEYLDLSTWARLRMVREVAAGMRYLHSKKPAPVLHLDLKTGNLLLDNAGTVVLADFGLSTATRANLQGTAQTDGALTISISPPEVLKSPTAPRSAPADVYAFGIVLLEIMTGQPAYTGMRAEEIKLAVCSGQRPRIPESMAPDLATLVRSCWSQNPSDRPGFEQVVELLDAISSAMRLSVTTTSAGAETTTMF